MTLSASKPKLNHDFDTHHPRTQHASTKWLEMETYFGHKDLLPLWVADMDFQVAPPIQRAITDMAHHSIYGYMYRDPDYFQAIVDWYQKRHQWTIKTDWLQFSPGVITTLSFLIEGLTQADNKIMIQEPVYHPFKHKILEMGRDPVINQLIVDQEGLYHIDFHDFEEQLYMQRPKIFILCNPHNPIGRVWTQEELKHMGDLCLKYQVTIVSDEIHSDLVFAPNKHIPIASLSDDLLQSTITLAAPSKTFNLAGLQTSFAICPNPVHKALLDQAFKRIDITRNNSFSLVATHAAYREGEAWLTDLLTYIKYNADYLQEYIKTHMPGVRVHPLQGTYLAWVDFTALGLTDDQLEHRFLTIAKVALNRGTSFGAGGAGHFRINLACPNATLRDALGRIREAMGDVFLATQKEHVPTEL